MKTKILLLNLLFCFSMNAQFSPEQLISDNGAHDIYPCDLDGDGDIDLVAATYGDDTIGWYENFDGLGNFGGRQIISTNADQARTVHAADLDGDGDLDVISGSQADAKIAWYENDGLGNFGPQEIISTNATSVHDVYATDLDDDGDMDVLAALFGSNMVVWYENTNGQGNFSNAKQISTLESAPYAIYPSDLDGDGDKDLLCAAWQGNRITWFENLDGQGNFGTARVISINANAAQSVFAEDIDDDGDMDVLFTSLVDGKVAWHKNLDGLGDFGTEQIITLNANGATCVYAADLDNNGSMDALSTSEDGKIAWYKNTDGQGTFGPQEVLTTTNASTSVFGADMDGDGDNDVVSGGVAIVWFENMHPLSVYENHHVGISIFPNPVKNKLQISVPKNSTIQYLKIFDSSGKKVIEKGNESELDLSRMPSGIYVLEVKIEKGIFTEKIIKE